MIRPVASQKVEMKGLENTAGSAPIFFATSGISPPTIAAMMQIDSSVSPITAPIAQPRSEERRVGKSVEVERRRVNNHDRKVKYRWQQQGAQGDRCDECRR